MPQTGFEKLLELANPLPKPAEAAPWPEVFKALMKLAPQEARGMNMATMKALERLTEEYPAVQKAVLTTSPGRTFWSPPFQVAKGKWGSGMNPYGYGDINIAPYTWRENLYRKMGQSVDPKALDYSHEASHALGGEPIASNVDLIHAVTKAGIPYHHIPIGASSEGFAEGLSNTLLDMYNKNARVNYYQDFKYGPPSMNALMKYYLRGGELGADVGSTIRGGGRVDPQSISDALFDILKQR